MNSQYEITPKEKESHTRAIIMNIVFIIGCALVVEFFAMSNYDEITTKTDTANAAIAKIEAYKAQWVSFPQYRTFMNAYQTKKVTLEESDADLFTAALAKDPSSPLDYISWVDEEISSGSLSRYNEIEQKNSAIIGDILPTLGEADASSSLEIQKNIITLTTLTKYVEESILKKFSLDSTSPVSMGDVTYDSVKSSTTNIGSFAMSLDVTGKNSNIIAAIAAIQDSGKLSVENGELVAPNPASVNTMYSNLWNLLIGIDSVDAKDALVRNDTSNSVTLKLRFYVKGRTYGSYLQIKNMVIEKYGKLNAGITAALTTFKSKPPKTNSQMDAVSDLRNLLAQINTVSPKIEEIQKAVKVTEFTGQFDKLLSTYSSLKAIETRFEKDSAALK